jgi:hypothetical protein
VRRCLYIFFHMPPIIAECRPLGGIPLSSIINSLCRLR